MNNLGATRGRTEEGAHGGGQKQPCPRPFLNWTGTLLAGIGETLVLLYLLLASGDLFLQKLVRVMPTLRDKKSAVEISHEIQQNISNYLFSVSLINIGLGIVVSGGLYFMGVPNAAMWGMLVAVLNFVPYFGPVAGSHPAGHRRSAHIRNAVAGIPSARLVSAVPPVGSEPRHAGLAGTPIHAQSRAHFCSLIFWIWLWGVPGALLSVPILVSIKVISDRVPAMSPVSELLTS